MDWYHLGRSGRSVELAQNCYIALLGKLRDGHAPEAHHTLNSSL